LIDILAFFNLMQEKKNML